MKDEHPCFHKFIKVPTTPKSKESYAYKIQRFMKFAAKFQHAKHAEDFESLLQYDSEKITDILEEFVNYRPKDWCTKQSSQHIPGQSLTLSYNIITSSFLPTSLNSIPNL
jgi:hypothetical protein